MCCISTVHLLTGSFSGCRTSSLVKNIPIPITLVGICGKKKIWYIFVLKYLYSSPLQDQLSSVQQGSDKFQSTSTWTPFVQPHFRWWAPQNEVIAPYESSIFMILVFSLIWFLRYLIRLELLTSAVPHWLHVKNRSPVWDIWCTINGEFWLKIMPHWLHL